MKLITNSERRAKEEYIRELEFRQKRLIIDNTNRFTEYVWEKIKYDTLKEEYDELKKYNEELIYKYLEKWIQEKDKKKRNKLLKLK